MKKIYLLGAALAAVVLASCSQDENNEPQYAVLTFEQAPLLAGPTEAGENLYSADYAYPTDPDFDGPRFTSYTDSETGLTFGVNVDEGESWSTGNPEFSAGGIVPSRWHDMEMAGYLNQCSVYGTGGHAGSATFGVVYAPVSFEGDPMPAVMSFGAGVERTVESLWVAGATYAVLYEPQDLTLTIEGFNTAGVSVGTRELELAGLTSWTQLSLEELGEVNSLEFLITSTDSGAPAYCCIDDVRVVL